MDGASLALCFSFLRARALSAGLFTLQRQSRAAAWSLSSPAQRQLSHRNPSHRSPSKQCILISVCLFSCRTRRRDFRKNLWVQSAQYKFTPMKSGMTQNFGCVVEKEFWILIANFQGNCCNESWTLVLTLAISGRDVILYRTACMISKQDKNLETMEEFGTY